MKNALRISDEIYKDIDKSLNFFYTDLQYPYPVAGKEYFVMKMDKTNLAIIKHLKDGRKSFREIAEAVDISENTVRARVNNLRKEGILEISGFVDPESVPGHRVVIVGVKLASMDLINKGKEFSKLRGVVSVSVVTGRYDLMVVVLLNESFGLLEFYTLEVARLSGVQSVETFVVYKGYNLKVPYVL